MDLYTLLRQFADSWALLALTLFFIGVVIFAFRPGSARMHRDIANIPLRNDTLPATGRKAARTKAEDN
ncbi:cbb3-type cytochrome c oxidase subunit 3 [Halovulum dunhuangense]|uniref:Cbb3-type cytochrome c oxidase subunit 3 n=1 Tax=Halovulum dunhuangense TaxID=1505036 RepID=A0A849KX25_9RHOB|nr:cbb3-type cytochrome c oxidase subunit 3 [Halovulum dunhuangense]NNU78957.1 cbb3-type cytochrome c oxidase subunit 3 [Halovulum dunhuangense]